MSVAPPVLGRALLWLCLPQSELDTVPGDLEEEFTTVIVPERGTVRANQWYLQQVLRSVAPLMRLRWRQREITRMVLAGCLTLTVPTLVLNSFWSYILSQVPLKADSVRSAGFLLFSSGAAFACLAVGGFVIGAMAGRDNLRAAALLAVCVFFQSLLVVLLYTSQHPIWYPIILLVLAPAGALSGGYLRQLQRGIAQRGSRV